MPDRRGQGIGRRLLHAAEDACRGRGVSLLEVNVDGEDRDARRFYERHGYSDREPGQAEPELHLHRDL